MKTYAETSYELMVRIAGEHDVLVSDLHSPCRNGNLVAVRRVIAGELRRRKLSLSRIGMILHRHHSSILHLLTSNPHTDGFLELQSYRHAFIGGLGI